MLKPRRATAAPALILSYWTLALVLLLSVATGLQVAASFRIIGRGLAVPAQTALSANLASGLLLVAASILFLQRMRQDPPRRRDVFARRSWHRAHALVVQSLFALVALHALCALLLAAGGDIGLARLDFMTTLLLVLAVPAHVGLQLAIGGTDRILRMLRPGRPERPPLPLGQVDPSGDASGRGRRSTHLLGFALGIVFGAAAMTAFVTTSAGQGSTLASVGQIFVRVAWGLPLGPAR